MSDEQLTGDQGSGTKPEDADAFLENLRKEKCQRREFAEAFAKEQAGRSTGGDLRAVQQEQAAQLAQLDREISQLRRSLRIAQCCGGVVGVALLGIAGYLIAQPNFGLAFITADHSATPSLNGANASDSASTVPELVLAPDLEFEIQTDVDRKYQLIIRQFYGTVRTIRRPGGSLDERVGATDDYVRFMTDVSRVIEEAGQEGVSPEIILALSNLALLGQELRKVERLIDLDIETQNRKDQIEAVLRAPDARSLDSESRP